MKKVLSMFLCLLMVVSVIPIIGLTASAATSGDFEYSILDDGTVEITKYKGSATLLEIPSEIDGEIVTSIGNRAFEDCTSLKSVTIGNGVISIGKYTFSGCIALTSVTFGNSVTSIGERAFENCKSLTSIIIPNGIICIGSFVFLDCSSLISVTIPGSVTSIGYNAFRNCTSLASIIIPNSVTSIGWWAFADCTSLKSVTFPDSVIDIGWNSFNGCTSLTSVTIPDSVKSIGSSAFDNCSSDLIIYGDKNSAAEKYAKNNNIKFADLNHTHSYTVKITKQPTCTEKGDKTYTCDCGESYTEEVSALGHKEVVDKAVAPTCTKSGLTKGKHCSVCGKVLTAQKKISAQGHKIITLKTKKATYFSIGYKNRKICKVCKKVVNKGKTLKKLKLKVPTFTVKCIGKGKVKISWKKVKDATGIYIVYDTQKACNFPVGGTEIKGNKTSKVLKNLASCDHYFKAEAFIYKNGKYVSSERTKAIKVKVK